MTHGQLLVNKIAQVLNSIGHECTSDDGRIVLPKWGLWVDVADGKVNERPDFVSILPTEMNGFLQVMQKGAKAEKLRFTTMIHTTREPVDGQDMDQLMAARTPPKPVSPPAPPASPAPTPASRRSKWRFW